MNLTIEKQKGERLCWSAVCVSLMSFFEVKPMDQISFAKLIMGESYDRFCSPIKPFSFLNLLREELDKPLTQAEIAFELHSGNPVVACMKHFVGWHLVVIHGIRNSEHLWVGDPLWGSSNWGINEFTYAYRQHYSWTHTYKIQHPRLT